MRKEIVLLLYFIMGLNFYAVCQKDSLLLAGYKREEYHKYLNCLHTQAKSGIQRLNHSYDCWVVFKIDTMGKIRDYELIEIPESPLPPLAKNYIKNLFNSTSGQWSFANQTGKTSGDILFWLTLKKTDQSFEQYFRDTMNTFEFLLMKLPKLSRLKEVNTDNDIEITLYY